MFGSLADDPPFLSPEWLALFDGACADAEELGFTLWMYDQIGFSGANFQGLLTARNPEFAGLASAAPAEAPTAARGGPPAAGHTALGRVRRAAGGRGGDRCPSPWTPRGRWAGRGGPAVTLVHSGVSGFDYFGAEACAALLDQVHGTLERHVGQVVRPLHRRLLPGRAAAMPTWGRDFAATFARPTATTWCRLVALWEGDDDASARVRRDYQEHRARLGRRAFFGPQRAGSNGTA